MRSGCGGQSGRRLDGSRASRAAPVSHATSRHSIGSALGIVVVAFVVERLLLALADDLDEFLLRFEDHRTWIELETRRDRRVEGRLMQRDGFIGRDSKACDAAVEGEQFKGRDPVANQIATRAEGMSLPIRLGHGDEAERGEVGPRGQIALRIIGAEAQAAQTGEGENLRQQRVVAGDAQIIDARFDIAMIDSEAFPFFPNFLGSFFEPSFFANAGSCVQSN